MKYYCLGIKGAGMSTLANILYDLGNDVIGYDDEKDYKFTEKGLEELYNQAKKIDETIIILSNLLSLLNLGTLFLCIIIII